jgi:hypothetical protein
MMRRAAWFVALSPLGGAEAQDVTQTALRHDEDWSILQTISQENDDWWRPLKYQPLDDEGRIYLTLGGEVRARYEGYANSLWGQSTAPDDGYLWLRTLPHADLHAGPVRGFVQGIAGYALGVAAGKGPIDETGIDVLQSFVDIRLPIGENGALTLRAGRELIALGSERLVGSRYGTNIPQPFDGIHAIFEHRSLRVDAFHLRPVVIGLGDFDDRKSRAKRLDGVYATLIPASGIGIDLYWLGYVNENARFAAGAGREQRNTMGFRFFGQRGPFAWNWGAVRQRGQFDAGTIRAWSVASETSWRFIGLPLQPRVRVRANIVSGDRDPTDAVLETSNALFPKGHYFGELSPIGPANIINVHPGIDLTLGKGLTLGIAGVAYWRKSLGDGIYSLSGALVREPGAASSRFIGRQVEIVINWQVSDIFSLSAAAARFAAGDFIRETGSSRTIHMTAFDARMRF